MMTRVYKSLGEKYERGIFLYNQRTNNERKEHDRNSCPLSFPGTVKMAKSVLDRFRLAQKRGDAEIILSKFNRGISKTLR